MPPISQRAIQGLTCCQLGQKYDTVTSFRMALCNELGRFFYIQGRPNFYSDGCVTYCFVKYQHRYSGVSFVEEFVKTNSWSQDSTRSVHAEEMVLRYIVMTELNENW